VFFGKQHQHILRAIDGLGCSSEFRGSNFGLTNESRITGRSIRDLRSFNMTKDGFTFLVMGFTGKKAASPPKCGLGLHID
jgi:Rha family phage regulatory protein